MNELMLKCFKNFFLENDKVFSEQSVYGVTIYLVPEMNGITCVIGTEECLIKCIEEYISLGWRNKETSGVDGFDVWLRWSGPEESAWTGIHSKAFDEFNAAMLIKLKHDELELYSDYIPDLLTQNIDAIKEFIPTKRIPVVCSYYEHDFELEEINKKLNPTDIYKKYETEANASMQMNKKVDKVK